MLLPVLPLTLIMVYLCLRLLLLQLHCPFVVHQYGQLDFFGGLSKLFLLCSKLLVFEVQLLELI